MENNKMNQMFSTVDEKGTVRVNKGEKKYIVMTEEAYCNMMDAKDSAERSVVSLLETLAPFSDQLPSPISFEES